jgi:hypothetical protein
MAERRLALACAIMLSNASAPARSVLKIIESPAMPDRSVARRMTLLGREKTRCQRPSKVSNSKRHRGRRNAGSLFSKIRRLELAGPPLLCRAPINNGTANASPKTKQPVHRSDLPVHQFQLQPVPHQFQLHPMQFAVPPHLWTTLTSGEQQPALTAAVLPPLTANWKLERRRAQAWNADGQQQPCGEQHLQWWPILPQWTPSLRLRES